MIATRSFRRLTDWQRRRCFLTTRFSVPAAPMLRTLFYTNVDPKFRIMAVYGGATLAEAESRARGSEGNRRNFPALTCAHAHRLQWHLSRTDTLVCLPFFHDRNHERLEPLILGPY